MYKTWLKSILLVSFLFIHSPLLITAAQNSPAGPVYIVQEGDSLWEIADRFHVSPEALADANGITNPDQITIGQSLIIPGLEGIEGILTTQPIQFGDNLRSLSIQYQISPQFLMQLNHITSPSELYSGFSLVIPQNETTSPGKRITLNPGQSVLELAIQNNANPWTLLVGNGSNNSTSLIPGDVIRAPGEADSGPGGLPPSISSVDITGLTQGKTAEILLGGDSNITVSGSFMEKALLFFQTTDEKYIALQGVHAMAKPGLYPLALQISTSDDLITSFSQMVLVQAGDFPYDRSLPVDPATLDPETNRIENELWSELSSVTTTEQKWSDKFALPVDPAFAECYSSRFGNRRSYNGGEYRFFHTGLDFCGQVGDPIYAAAAGVVVFADNLTVRGKATMIDHGLGIYTAYMHQSEILVSVGESVEKGQLIGLVGNTGRVEGPHLHFEVIVGGVQVDPLDWLSKEFP